MGLRINDIVPNFTAETDHGTITFHDWIGDSWAILFSHPKDFTPVCTTEFGAVAQLSAEWDKRGVKTRYEAFPGANHFTVLDPLTDPASAMTQRVVELTKQAHALPL